MADRDHYRTSLDGTTESWTWDYYHGGTSYEDVDVLHIKFILTYKNPDDGTSNNAVGYYQSTYGPLGTNHFGESPGYATSISNAIGMTDLGDGTVELEFYNGGDGHPGGNNPYLLEDYGDQWFDDDEYGYDQSDALFDYKWNTTVIAIKNGFAEEEEEEEVEAPSETAEWDSSEMYLASLSDSTEFDSDTHLIKQDTFALKWNSFGSYYAWDQDIRSAFNAIDADAWDGEIVLLKEEITTTENENFNYYYSLEAGHIASGQTGPVFTLATTGDYPRYTISYDTAEQNTITNRYVYSTGLPGITDWPRSVENGISDMASEIIRLIENPVVKYNFRKIYTNSEFFNKNLTAFENIVSEKEEIKELNEVEEFMNMAPPGSPDEGME